MRDGKQQGRLFAREFVQTMTPSERAVKIPELRHHSLRAARSAERRGDRYAADFNTGLAEALGSPRALVPAPALALVAAGFPGTSPSRALVAAGSPRTPSHLPDGKQMGRSFARDFVQTMTPSERAVRIPELRHHSVRAARSAERRGDRYGADFNTGLAEALGSPRALLRPPASALVAAGFPRTSPSRALVAAGFPRASPASRPSRAPVAVRHPSAGSWSAVMGEILPPRRRTRKRAKVVKRRPRRRTT